MRPGGPPGRPKPRRRAASRCAALAAGLLLVGFAVGAGADERFMTRDMSFGVRDMAFPVREMAASTREMRQPLREMAVSTREASQPVEAMAVPVEETDDEVRFRLTGDVLFDFDRADIRPEAEAALRQLVAQIAERFDRPTIRVEGHTDSKGSDAYNLTLSQRRAEAVKNWLVGIGGLPAATIATTGFGKSRPVAPNAHPDGSDNPEGRRQNRRVEIIVLKDS